MRRRTYKRSTLFCVEKASRRDLRAGWKSASTTMCTSSSSSSSSRRGTWATIPIIVRALTTCGYHQVRKPPPLYIPAGSPRRPQPPGTAKLRQHPPPYVPEGSQKQPPPRGHRGVAPTTALSTRRFSSCRLLPRRENRRFTSSVCETDWRVPRSWWSNLPIYNRWFSNNVAFS